MLPRLKARASRDWIPTPYIPRAMKGEYYGVGLFASGLYPSPEGLSFTPSKDKKNKIDRISSGRISRVVLRCDHFFLDSTYPAHPAACNPVYPVLF